MPWPLEILNSTRWLLVHGDFAGDSALAALGVLQENAEHWEEAIRVHRPALFLCFHDPIDRFLCDRSLLLIQIFNNNTILFVLFGPLAYHFRGEIN